MTAYHSRHDASSAGEDELLPFREVLRSYRVLAGLTQQALAASSKISTRTIRDLEAGRANARIQTIHLLANALQLTGPARVSFVHAGLRNQKPGPAGPQSPDLALPKPINVLLGRDREVRAMVRALGTGRSRIISLSGLPGVGKTRVATEIAAQLSTGNNWPVVWMGEGIRTHARLNTSLSPLIRSLHSLIERNAAGMAKVRDYFRDREALIVLDGIADVQEPVGIEELLASCPGIRVISTSRLPWQVAGLQSAVISPLATPAREQDADLSPDALAGVPSARLFLDRLSEVRPGFDVTPADARAVAAMCRRLDGLPLALEAAARRFRVISLPQLAEVPMADLLDLSLPARPGAGPETIADLLGWSVRHQDAERQAVLRQLASYEESLTTSDVVRLLRRPLDAVIHDLSALADAGLVLASHGGSSTLLHVPNLLRAFLQRSPGPAD